MEFSYCFTLAKIVKMICDIGTFYSSQMYKILSSELEKKEKNPVAFEVNEKYCVGINNTQVSYISSYYSILSLLRNSG